MSNSIQKYRNSLRKAINYDVDVIVLCSEDTDSFKVECKQYYERKLLRDLLNQVENKRRR